MSDIAARRQAARQQAEQARHTPPPKKPLSNHEKARRALATQALPMSWADQLTDRQIDLLASTISPHGTATPGTAAIARMIRREVLDAHKASADDDVELTD